MFLTVVRSATERLVISCAKKDGNRTLQPSTYINSIEKLFGSQIIKKDLMDSLNLNNAPEFDKSLPPGTKTVEYKLNELAHYGLCPLRYRLETLNPEAKMYRDDWQLEVASQGV